MLEVWWIKRMSALSKDVVPGICISPITHSDWEVCVIRMPFYLPRERLSLYAGIASKEHFPKKLSTGKYFTKVFTIHESISFYQVDIDIWHISSVGIMIMNVLWENLNQLVASLEHPCWKRLQAQCGDAKETEDVTVQHIYDIHQDMAIWAYYKNKEHVQRHLCVSTYLCKGNSETGILTWLGS